MKNCIIKVVGGLGNQLHCYAFGRAIAHRNNAVLKLEIESSYRNDSFGRVYLLSEFPGLKGEIIKTPNFFFGRFGLRILIKITQKISPLFSLKRRMLIQEKASFRYQEELHKTEFLFSTYFIGYWASYLYYSGIEDQLRNELKPSRPNHPAAIKLLIDIEASRSCSIHFRTYEEDVSVMHPSLLEYYRKAIELIILKFPKTIFYIFSDNLKTAKSQLSFLDIKAVYVDIPEMNGNIHSLTDFYLMYACSNAIIGDSTFSWWAAWLSDSDSKFIIAPAGVSPWGNDWIPENWTSINYI